MIIQVNPPLDGIAAERFIALAKQLEVLQQRRMQIEYDDICENEVNWSRNNEHLKDQKVVYESAARVLIDLSRLSWRISVNGYSIQLQSPALNLKKKLSNEEILNYKATIRNELSAPRSAQLNDPSVRRFINELEVPSPSTKKKSVLSLIADGLELKTRLTSVDLENDMLNNLKTVIKPYLQLIPKEGNDDCFDEFTGHSLRDIWRYFRYTWVIPQLPIPGRKIYYLVRDAAHPNHAIMGIAQLSNTAMQLKDRDNYIGWTYQAIVDKVALSLNSNNPCKNLQEIHCQLTGNIDKAIQDIDFSGLASEDEIKNPSLDVVSRLRRKSQDFAKLRQDALKAVFIEDNQPIYLQENEHITTDDLPPISEDVLTLENKNFKGSMKHATAMLIAKKRAFELARLLNSIYYLNHYKSKFLNPQEVVNVISKEEIKVAINTALLANKSSHVGSNMLEITTCGGVEPYSTVLSGKLTALLMLSPKVLEDYRKRYENEPSIISSQMKNEPLCRDATLVYLGTTSLYAKGSSQYNRLSLPSGTICTEQHEIKYKKIGYTSGFGTVQFSSETVRVIERLLEHKLGYQNVNSIFGEGPSPRFRKLNTGLAELGFNPEALMRHNQQRIIYALVLCKETLGYLRGESVELPDFVTNPGNYLEATDRIIDFWLTRWLSNRIKNDEILNKLSLMHGICLSERIPTQLENKNEEVSYIMNNEATHNTLDPDMEFWRSLASAGKSVCSDELDLSDLERLNIPQPKLESFIIKKVREGFSIVLTGNAGDGKTFILKRLEEELLNLGATVQFDATAVMKRGKASVILDEWKQQIASGQAYCLAANEYPLYQLREQGRSILPIITEVDRQCQNRLSYGEISQDEEAKDSVIVIDLSLRNPISAGFMKSALECILNDATLAEYAQISNDLDFMHNFNKLKTVQVQQRLIELFNRLVQRGYRAPIRELWVILARLLFGNNTLSDEVSLSPDKKYSEVLFKVDERFELSKMISTYCDPYSNSHPHWDKLIETDGLNVNDWLDKQEPFLSLRGNEMARFIALKRLFYFEHKHGDETFDLESNEAKEFKQLLEDVGNSDLTFIKKLIETINLCYCPIKFDGIRDALHLWVGHRYHEKPTKVYLSNLSIPCGNFNVYIPRLPKRLDSCIDYSPDHFLLRHINSHGAVSLRIDYGLYETLTKIKRGLPRHLIPDKHICTLDQFIERLLLLRIPGQREFVCFNAEQQLGVTINISSDWSKYTEVASHE